MSGKDSEDKITLYHYTNEQGYKGIEEDNVIYESTGPGDVAYGEGVYLTSIPPETDKDEILQNNYDDGSDVSSLMEGKADYCIEVELPKDEVTKVDSDRSIYVHEGDLYLDSASGK